MIALAPETVWLDGSCHRERHHSRAECRGVVVGNMPGFRDWGRLVPLYVDGRPTPQAKRWKQYIAQLNAGSPQPPAYLVEVTGVPSIMWDDIAFILEHRLLMWNAFAAVQYAQASGSPVTVTTPTANNIGILFVSQENTTTDPAPSAYPTGFTAETGTRGSSKNWLAPAWKVMAGSEGTSLSVTYTGAGDNRLSYAELSGNATSTPVDAEAATKADGFLGAGANITFSAITTATDNAAVIAMVGTQGNGNNPTCSVVSSGYTNIGNGDLTRAFFKTIASHGSETPGNATLAGNAEVGTRCIAIKPSGGAAQTPVGAQYLNIIPREVMRFGPRVG